MSTGDRLMVIDGANLVMRCLKAMEHSGLRSGEDWQTGPLIAVIGALSKFVRDHRPEYLVVCWDAGPSRYRRDLYPEYKIARKEVGPEFQDRKDTAFGMVKTFLRHAGITQVACEGFEADDVVAAYWAMARAARYDVMIVSGDKDFLQLLDPGVSQLRPNPGGYTLWTAEEVREKYGCEPDQLPLVMALTGDPVDGIPGVFGIGPKKALSGLQMAEWELAEVQALQDPVKRSYALLSYKLVNLRDVSQHPPVPSPRPFDPTEQSHGKPFLDLILFLRSLDMETIIQKIYTNTLWN